MIQQIIFLLVLSVASWFGYKGFSRVRRNILLGKDEKIDGNRSERWRNVFFVAFGQKKMFKLTTAAILHLIIYVSFVVTQIELLDIFVDGIFGTHRFFAPILGGFYTFVISLIEILSVLTLVVTIAFLARRFVLKLPRFQKPELRGFPMRDAAIILFAEIILITGIFCMNGADKVLQTRSLEHYHATGNFAISTWLGHALFGGFGNGTLIGIERFGWWLHVLTVFGFLVYLPFSKHLHIILAFPATFFAKLTPKGQIENMPEIQKEVRLMMGLDQPDPNEIAPTELPEFGANDVFSLGWTNLLQAYSCTECGRCTNVCPANLTGKKLSPRKIMMDVRDRMEEVGQNIDSGKHEIAKYDDGKSLFDRISAEEIHACTTCNACVEACPILLNPLDIIVQLRRHEILTQSAGPTEWLPLFNAIENSGACWQMPVERDAWRNG
jgi:heterodisulfide reductase subunit C